MHNSELYTTEECTAREGFNITGYSESAKLSLVVHTKGIYTVRDLTTGSFYCIEMEQSVSEHGQSILNRIIPSIYNDTLQESLLQNLSILMT